MRIAALTSPEIADCAGGLLVRLENKNQNSEVTTIVVSIGRELRKLCGSNGRLLDMARSVVLSTYMEKVVSGNGDCQYSLLLGILRYET